MADYHPWGSQYVPVLMTAEEWAALVPDLQYRHCHVHLIEQSDFCVKNRFGKRCSS